MIGIQNKGLVFILVANNLEYISLNAHLLTKAITIIHESIYIVVFHVIKKLFCVNEIL